MNSRKEKSQQISCLTQVKRICDCSPNRLNCMTGKEWVKAMVGVWEFPYEARDIRDKKIHVLISLHAQHPGRWSNTGVGHTRAEGRNCVRHWQRTAVKSEFFKQGGLNITDPSGKILLS